MNCILCNKVNWFQCIKGNEKRLTSQSTDEPVEGMHCQASTSVDATWPQRKRTTKEHLEKRSGGDVDSRMGQCHWTELDGDKWLVACFIGSVSRLLWGKQSLPQLAQKSAHLWSQMLPGHKSTISVMLLLTPLSSSIYCSFIACKSIACSISISL